MRMRDGFSVVCLVAIMFCSASLFAREETTPFCCALSEDCEAVGGVCCDPTQLGLPVCSIELPGQCMISCVREGG
jgi:hypothetical protein